MVSWHSWLGVAEGPAGTAESGQDPALAGLEVRAVNVADQGFLRELYAADRADEMRATGWPAARVRSFLDQQFDFQQRRQRELHPRARFLLLLRHDTPAGLLAWQPGQASGGTATLVDLLLLPNQRHRGLGRALLAQLIAAADRAGWNIALQLNRQSPMLEALRRRGFVAEEDDNMNPRLHRPPRALPRDDVPRR